MVLTAAAGGGGVSDRARPDGGPDGAAVGQGQLRLDGSGQVRLPRAGHPGRDPVHVRPGRDSRSASTGSWTASPRRRPGSTTCSAGPTRSGCSRSRAGPRSAPCPACNRAGSTTWSIEIALIRPGPIQGGAVHPYIRRATGKEEIDYLHPDLEPVLGKTLGVPLFQEQLMQIAMAVGDCTGDDADLLRRAMGSKRGVEKIERLQDKLYAGMAAARHHRRAGRRDLLPDPGLRQLRLRREPCDQLRPAGLRLVLAEAALSGGVPGRAAAGPADGLLLPAVAGRRRPPARGEDPCDPTSTGRRWTPISKTFDEHRRAGADRTDRAGRLPADRPATRCRSSSVRRRTGPWSIAATATSPSGSG